MLLLGFGLVALLLSRSTGWLKDRRVAELVQLGSDSSSQTPVRITMLLLVSLLVLAGELGLDVVLGAFAAGVVLRVTLPRGDERLERKLDGLAFGFFIPAFFVVSGMQVDIQSILHSPARLAVFPPAGTPVPRLPPHARNRPVVFPLPLIVAITEIGLRTRPENAAAPSGAGTQRDAARDPEPEPLPSAPLP